MTTIYGFQGSAKVESESKIFSQYQLKKSSLNANRLDNGHIVGILFWVNIWFTKNKR